MLTQFFNSINWVDVALAVVLIRVIYISVVSGFIIELFKFLSVICALFVSFHFYSRMADGAASATHVLPVGAWQILIFIVLLVGIMVALKFAREGVLSLFKVETTHAGVDKYAGGLVGCARAILACSLTVFVLLMIKHPYIHQQTKASWSKKIFAEAAPNTYSFLFRNMVGKLFDREQLNSDVFAVISGHGPHTK